MAGDTETKERQWNMQDWCWDPYNMLALASDPKAITGKAGGALGGAAHLPQPQLGSGASLLLDDANRAASRGKGAATCQVDGCSQDLTGLKEYHQRYKICEFHLKVNSIIREGKRQRFCQQCGRFHDLTSFDGDKRSCRARLQRHNARRRKKCGADGPADAAAGSGSGSGGKAPIGKKAAVSGGRRLIRGAESNGRARTQPQNSDSGGASEGRQQSLGARQESVEASSRQALDHARAGSGDSYMGALSRAQLSAGGIPGARAHSPTAAAGALQEGGVPSGQALASQLNSSSFAKEQVPIFDEAQGMVGTDNSGSGAATAFGGSLPSSVGGGGGVYNARDASMDGLDCLQDISFFPGGPQMPPLPDYSDLTYAVSHMQATFPDAGAFEGHAPADALLVHAAGGAAPGASAAACLVDEARAMLGFAGDYAAVGYSAKDHFTHMSAKLFNCSPEQLPSDLKANLLAMLQCGVNALEGYIRPGCLHLTLHAMVGSEEGAALKDLGVRALVQQLVSASDASMWRCDSLLIHWYDEVALVRDGKVLHVLSATGSRGVLPHIHSVTPLAALPSAACVLAVAGSNIAGPDNTVFARSQGHNVEVEVVSAEPDADRGSEFAGSLLRLALPAGQAPGCLHVEVARGALLSGPKPVLVIDSEAAVAEVNQLADGKAIGVDVDGFLLDMGRVMELKASVAASREGDATLPHRLFSAADVAGVAAVARRQLIFAIHRGWPGVAREVLPAVAADVGSVASAVRELEALTPGMPLLLAAVRSQSHQLVEMLLEWASGGGCELRAACPGPRGLTPLHLAAVMDDAGRMATLLTGLCVDGANGWTRARPGGASPADLAVHAGQAATHARVYEQLSAALAASTRCDVDEGMDSEDGEEDNGAMVEVDPTTGELLSFNGAAAGDGKAAAVGGDGACEEAPARSFLRMRGGGSFNRDGAPHHGAALETLAEEEGMAPFAKLKPVQAARPVCSSVPASREGSAGSIPEPGTPSALGEALAHMSEDSASSSCSAPAAAFFAQNSTSLAAPVPALASPAWAGNTRPGGLRARPAAGACEPLVEGDQQAVEYTPEDKGGKAGRDAALHGYYSGPGGGGAAACLGAKVAPTVFDRTSALASAALIAACGGLTLFMRHFGGALLE